LFDQLSNRPVCLLTQIIVEILTRDSTSISNDPLCGPPERLEIPRLSDSFIVYPPHFGREGSVEYFRVMDDQSDQKGVDEVVWG